MATASGVEKKVVLAIQSAKGTIAAVDAATAQYLRRVSSSLDLTKDTYQSNEIRADRQIGDFRHGVQSVGGSISGELSPGTYQRFMAAILRQAWQTAPTTGAVATITAAATSGAAGTFTMSGTGAFLTAGFKVGDVVRFTGWASPATANNAHNFLVTAVTATVMTVLGLDGVPPVAKSEGDTVTGAVVGKKTWTPQTGHSEDWFTIEHNFSDLDLSEVFWDCKPESMAIKLPASGMATVDVGIQGLQMTAKATGDAPYFTGPAAAGTAGVLAAVNGAIYVQGTKVAILTGMDINIAGNLSSEPVIGSVIKPDIFDGRIVVTGNMSLFFEDATFRDYFINETEVSVNAVFTASNAANADFLAFTMPRVKAGGASKDDGEKGIVQTLPFQALFNTGGGAATGATATDDLATTLSIQDSTVS